MIQIIDRVIVDVSHCLMSSMFALVPKASHGVSKKVEDVIYWKLTHVLPHHILALYTHEYTLVLNT